MPLDAHQPVYEPLLFPSQSFAHQSPETEVHALSELQYGDRAEPFKPVTIVSTVTFPEKSASVNIDSSENDIKIKSPSLKFIIKNLMQQI
jgi:hypothetical protein